MKLVLATTLAFGLGLTWSGASQQEDTATPAAEPPGAEAFALEALAERAREEGKAWLGFLDRPSLTTGLYRLEAGAKDGQSPHALDEVYYVVEGKATLHAGEETFTAVPGAILFVAAGVEHRFVDIEEDLTLVVFFSKAKDDDERP